MGCDDVRKIKIDIPSSPLRFGIESLWIAVVAVVGAKGEKMIEVSFHST
jgi:hypothetical protein